MQPALTMYKYCHSTFTSNLTSINSDASCINYVQALPQHFHKQSDKYQLRCNLHGLCTTSGKAPSQSIQQVSTPMQPALTAYKHCHSTFTINPTSINSDATCINYVQAPPQHVHNQSNKYQLQCNLHSLCTTTATAPSQAIQQVSTPMQPAFTTYKHCQDRKSVV